MPEVFFSMRQCQSQPLELKEVCQSNDRGHGHHQSQIDVGGSLLRLDLYPKPMTRIPTNR